MAVLIAIHSLSLCSEVSIADLVTPAELLCTPRMQRQCSRISCCT